MAALAAAWLLYPAALLALSLGLGLGLARLSGWDMPGALLAPTGFAALVALCRLITASPHTTRLALPAVVVLAIAGAVLGRVRLVALRPDPLIALAAFGVFLVFGAPVLLSGHPTFAGYTSLPDTSHQLAIADLFAHHGPDWQALPDGSDRRSLLGYMQTYYPAGGQIVLGVTAPLGVIDLAWLYQPLLTLLPVLVCLAISEIVATAVPVRWLRALVAFVVPQAALVMGYAQQGSIKELTALAMVVIAVSVVAVAARERRGTRSLLPAAVAAVGAVDALGPAVGAYLGILLLVVLAVWVPRVRRRRVGWRGEALWVAVAVALAAVLCIPLYRGLHTVTAVNQAVLTQTADLGNLAAPLSLLQGWGIWMNGDYRFAPGSHQYLNFAVAGAALAASGLGVLWALRTRAGSVLLMLAVFGPSSLYLLHRGSPYADAKVLMIAAPTGLLLALMGVMSLRTAGLRIESLLLAALLTGGVLVSNALAYHDVSLTPYSRYQELLSLDHRLAGKGPAIFNEYDEFAKYFLRHVPVYSQPEWPHGYNNAAWPPAALLSPARRPSMKTPLDPDDLLASYMSSVPYIILRRSPDVSRTPANFRMVWRGRYYELWQRAPQPRVLAHLPLGPDVFHPAAPPRCGQVAPLARRAQRAGGRLAFVERPPSLTLDPLASNLPPSWYRYGAYPRAVVPAGPGRAIWDVRLPAAETDHVWIEGSFGRAATVTIDGRTVGTVAHQLNNPGAYVPLATLRLRAGRHRVEVTQRGGTLAPGSGGFWASLRHIGPLVFSGPANEARRVQTVAPSAWRSLCGRSLDWIEVVR